MINASSSMEPNSWNNNNLHPKYSQVLRPEGKAGTEGDFSGIVHEYFCVWDEGSTRAMGED